MTPSHNLDGLHLLRIGLNSHGGMAGRLRWRIRTTGSQSCCRILGTTLADLVKMEWLDAYDRQQCGDDFDDCGTRSRAIC